MEKKDITSGGPISDRCWGGGDNVYLRRELGKVLPAALATVVQLQPADPITVLALWLHKYRELHPLPSVSTDPSDKKDHADNKSQGIQTVSSVKLAQSCDIVDISGAYLEDSVRPNAAVHNEVITEFVSIGDIFDDDDLG
ncbi:hypothetical protein V1264_019899 [Littorina saxatilis]|uniref:Uncharacterized protein n=1 Tax=Littorina saxatilis TaxID=31220 RepID=A0AAN9B9S6_9CAEN